METKKKTPPTDYDSIITAKAYLRENWKEGVGCPCCTQFVKLYNRKITSAMAYGLLLLYKHYQDTGEWTVHTENFFKAQDCPSSIRGDFSKLRHWKLIQKDEELGYYSLTKAGIDFCEGKRAVPRMCKIFNGTVYGFSDDYTTIKKALGDKFDYIELMGYDVQKEEATKNPIGVQQELL